MRRLSKKISPQFLPDRVDIICFEAVTDRERERERMGDEEASVEAKILEYIQ